MNGEEDDLYSERRLNRSSYITEHVCTLYLNFVVVSRSIFIFYAFLALFPFRLTCSTAAFNVHIACTDSHMYLDASRVLMSTV